MSQEQITTDSISPDAFPEELKPSSGVRRVNNMPLILALAAATVFLIVMMLVAMDRAEQQNQPVTGPEAPKSGGSTSQYAKEAMAGYGESGMIPPSVVIESSTETDVQADFLPPENASPWPDKAVVAQFDPNQFAPPSAGFGDVAEEEQRTPIEDEVERLRIAKVQQIRAAATSRTSVQSTGLGPISPQSVAGALSTNPHGAIGPSHALQHHGNRPAHNDPTAAYLARLEQVKGLTGTGGGGSTAAPAGLFATDPKSGSFLDKADNGTGADRWRISAKPEAPRSPYELRAGFVIPGVLISGINSDLQGSIMAQVSRNVYDTATGRHLLIPQGSRLMGTYDNQVNFGQKRVLIAWQRIIFPDGKAMDVGALPGADVAGYSGFKDQVNNHYGRLLGSALLLSAVTAGISLSQDNNNNRNSNDRRTASEAISEALGQQLGQVTAQLISRNMNISPTIEIRPGYRFNIVATKDLTFARPYRSFDY